MVRGQLSVSHQLVTSHHDWAMTAPGADAIIKSKKQNKKNQQNIGSDNGLSPNRRQAII